VAGGDAKDVQETVGLFGPESDSLSESVHSVVGGDSSTRILYALWYAIPPLYAPPKCNRETSPNVPLSTVLRNCGYTGVIAWGGIKRGGVSTVRS
jgi:hypothetical protein